jgi:hypothetical protein
MPMAQVSQRPFAQRLSGVTGRVIAADDESPVPGAMVNATVSFGRSRITQRRRSDNEGRFLITSLPEGALTLTVIRAGFIDYGGERQKEQPHVLGQRQLLTVPPIRLARTSVVSGTVRDAAGEPEVLAKVAVYRVRATQGGSSATGVVGLAFTDDQGHYRIPGLSPGEYLMSVQPKATLDIESSPDGLPKDISSNSLVRSVSALPTFYPSADTPLLSTLLKVGLGETLPSTDVTLPRRQAGEPIVLRVSSRSGRDLRRVTIAISSRDWDPFPGAAAQLYWTQLSDGDLLRLESLPVGSYRLHVRAYSDNSDSSEIVEQRDLLTCEVDVSVVEAGLPQSSIHIVLVEGTDVRGTVTFESITQKSIGDLAAFGTRVSLQPVDSPTDAFMLTSGVVDNQGNFVVTNVPNGRYILKMLSLPPSLSIQHATYGGHNVDSRVFEVLSTSDNRSMSIVTSDIRTGVSGVVRDRLGRTTGGALAQIIHQN